jgi:glycosyltransferase involved in cell wall biosynthesis
MVSALITSKRVELGIEAVSQIPGAHLVVAGDGPLRDMIDATAKRLLPDRFTRVSVAPERMPALYQSANVFLHLSQEEAFGNVFLEAMACGLPVVAHNTPRVRWIVGNDEFLLDTGDPAAIAWQIKRAGRSTLADRRERTIKAAAFSWAKIAGLYRDFLQEIIASPGRVKN